MAENIYSQIKVGMDWEGKGMICFGAKPGDPLNLLPNPTSMALWTVDSAWSRIAWGDGSHSPTPFYLWGVVNPAVLTTLRLFNATDGVDGSAGFAPVSASTQYTLVTETSFVGTATNPAARVLRVLFHDAGGFLISSATTTLVADGTTALSFTTPALTTAITVRYEFYTGYSHTVTALLVKSVMLVAGNVAANPPAYNTGTLTSLYDDVTDRVLRFEMTIGYADRFSLMANEGTAGITLLNDDRRFSPRQITGVYPGDYAGHVLEVGTTFVIKHRKDAADGWTTAFVGQVDEIEVIAGSQRDRMVNVRCKQGITSMDRHSGDIGIVPGKTVAEHITEVYHGDGAFTAWVYPYLRTDDGTFPLDAGVLFGPLTALDVQGTSVLTTNPGITIDWPQTLGEIVRAAVDIDGGKFFVRGDGRALFVARDYMLTAPSVMTWDYEDFNEDVYIYDSNVSNTFDIDFTHQPLNDTSNQIVLGEETFPVPIGVDVEVTVPYTYRKEFGDEFSYGNHITQTLEVRRQSDNSLVVGGMGISFIGEDDTSGRTDNSGNLGWGTQIRFRLYNYTGLAVNVKVTVTGVGMLPDEAGTVTEYTDTASVLKFGRLRKGYSNIFVTDNTLAAAYAAQKMAHLSTPAQYFKNFAFVAEADKVWLMATELGDVIELDNEYITGTANLFEVVIGKALNWEPNNLRVEFTLAPII